MTMDFETRVSACKRTIRARSIDGIERRSVGLSDGNNYVVAESVARVEARDSSTSDGAWQVVGHGYVFNSMSENLGGFREIVEPGFGADVLAKAHDIRGLINHNPDLILGRTPGTMTVEEDSIGSAYVIDAPDTSYAADLRVSLDRGDINQSSFAFRVARGGDVWEEDDETGLLLRRLIKASGLYDMSPVTYPAYPETDSAARTAPDLERENDGAADERVLDGEATDRQADGLSREYLRRDLKARERLLGA